MGNGIDEGQPKVEGRKGLVFVCVDEMEQVVGGFVMEGVKVGLVDDFFFGEASSYRGAVGACISIAGVGMLGKGAGVCCKAGVGGGGRKRGSSWVEVGRRRRTRGRVEESGGEEEKGGRKENKEEGDEEVMPTTKRRRA